MPGIRTISWSAPTRWDQWYTFLTTPADNGAHIYAVASVAYPDYSSISVTSAVSTLTLNPGPLIYTNGLKREIFANAVRQDVEDGSVAPGVVSMVSAADVGGSTVNGGQNYAERFSGYFIPPTSGGYVFFINSDDDSDLYLTPTAPLPTSGSSRRKKFTATPTIG